MFETLIPRSLIRMYGGMLFGMRDSMAAGSLALTQQLPLARSNISGHLSAQVARALQ
jgi:hypothetical protein